MASLIMAIVSAVIAGISAAISIVSCIYNNKQTKKINNINIKSRYFEKIFDEYLIYKIPEARQYIRFNEKGHLDDFQKMIDELSGMSKSASFFRFDNKEFFNKLKSVTQELENYLSDCGNKSFDNEEQANVYKEIADRTIKVYACISDYYLGI